MSSRSFPSHLRSGGEVSHFTVRFHRDSAVTHISTVKGDVRQRLLCSHQRIRDQRIVFGFASVYSDSRDDSTAKERLSGYDVHRTCLLVRFQRSLTRRTHYSSRRVPHPIRPTLPCSEEPAVVLTTAESRSGSAVTTAMSHFFFGPARSHSRRNRVVHTRGIP